MLEALFDTAHNLLVTLGWVLIHSIWQCGLIAMLYACFNWILKNQRPQLRYWNGLVAMICFIAAPILTFISLYQPLNVTGDAAPTMLATSLLPPFEVNATLGSVVSFSERIESLLPWLVLLWMVGVVALSVRVARRWRSIQLLVRVGTHPLSDTINHQVQRLSEQFGIRRKVQVLESALIKIPTVLGWLKPVILLPSSTIVGLTPSQLELVIAHELGHVKRYDFLVNWCQVVVETLMFYHPVVRWVSRRIREDREQCCDDMVINACGNRMEYARALANLETMRSGTMAPALGASEGQLLQRIERIVCSHSRVRDAVTGNSGIAIILAALILLAGSLVDPAAYFDQKRNKLAEALTQQMLSSLSVFDDVVVDQNRQGDDLTLLSVESMDVPAQQGPVTAAADPNRQRRVSDQSLAGNTAGPATPDAVERVRQSTSAPVSSAPIEAAAALEREASEPAPSTRAEPIAQQSGLGSSSALASERGQAAAADMTPTSSGFAINDTQPIGNALAAIPASSASNDTLKIDAIDQPVDRVSSPPVNEGPVPIVVGTPKYPIDARLSGKEGYVVVAFGISHSGRVIEPEVVDSWPRRTFDSAAIRAMKKWRYDPVSLTGVTQTRFTKRFEFDLDQRQDINEIKPAQECTPITGSRICRGSAAQSLFAQGATEG